MVAIKAEKVNMELQDSMTFWNGMEKLVISWSILLLKQFTKKFWEEHMHFFSFHYSRGLGLWELEAAFANLVFLVCPKL